MQASIQRANLHGSGAIAHQQRGQICSDRAPRLQVHGVFVIGVLHRPAFTQIPVTDGHIQEESQTPRTDLKMEPVL